MQRKRRPIKRIVQRHWLADFIKENPIKSAWIFLLGFGTLSLLNYFFYIEYFPNFDLQAATNVLLALTYVTALLSLAFSILLLIPSIAAAAFSNSADLNNKKRLLRFIFGITAWSALSFAFLGMTLAFSSGLTYPALSWICFIVMIACVEKRKQERALRKIRAGQTVAMSLRVKKINRKKYFNNVWPVVICITLQAFPLSVLAMVLVKGSELDGNNTFELVKVIPLEAIILAVAGGTFIFGAFQRPFSKIPVICIGVALLLPQTFGFAMHASGMFPMTMAQITKIGNFRAQRVAISAKACSNLQSTLGVICDATQTEPIQLCNVQVMSRMGTEVYLRAATMSPNRGNRSMVVPLFIPASQIDITQVDFSKKTLSLSHIDEELKHDTSVCPVSLRIRRGEASFAFDAFSLNDESRNRLSQIVQEIRKAPSSVKELRIVGYSDSIGNPSYNSWIARQRAAQVRVYMERELENLPKKIPIKEEAGADAVISTCGDGPRQTECEAPNRRVEITIVPV